MATTHMKSTPVHTVGELPPVGAPAPDFTLTGADLSPVTLREPVSYTHLTLPTKRIV